MGMGLVDKHRVCISVGYNLDYAIKKAEQFVEKAPNVEFTHVNKIKVGETIRTEKIMVKDLTTIKKWVFLQKEKITSRLNTVISQTH